MDEEKLARSTARHIGDELVHALTSGAPVDLWPLAGVEHAGATLNERKAFSNALFHVPPAWTRLFSGQQVINYRVGAHSWNVT